MYETKRSTIFNMESRKQQLIDEYENLQKQVQDDKDGKVSLEETTTQLENKGRD